MKAKQIFLQNNPVRLRSYVAWLIVPIMLVWLTFGYVSGNIKENPLWMNKKVLGTDVSVAEPYFKIFQSVSLKSQNGYITLWFDDAWLSQYLKAYPLLKNYGFPGAIAVPVNVIERKNYMNWAQVLTLQRDGWEITNHSFDHNCKMDSWDREKVVYEYELSKLTLWQHKVTSDIFVTPCGVDSNIMRQEAKRQFLGYRTVDPGINEVNNIDFYNLKVRNVDNNISLDQIKAWVDEAVVSKNWVILVFHQIDDSDINLTDDLFTTKTQDFEEILKFVKDTGIDVVVPSQMISL